MTRESRKERRKRERELEKQKRKAFAAQQDTIGEDEESGLRDSQVRLGSLLVFIIPFVIYCLTLFRTVPPSDAGELISGAHELGVLHPPGFPVYTILGWIFDQLPFGSSALKINLMSAFFNSLTYSVLFLVLSRALRSLWIPLIPILGFAFTDTVWFYSVSAEFFAVNHFFIALLFYTSYQFFTQKTERWLYLSALVFGIGLSNHQVLLFYGLPLFAVMAIFRNDLLKLSVLLKCAGLVALGLTPYLLLPIFASQNPYVNWGEVSGLSDLVRHMLRQEYGTFQLTKNHHDANLFLALFYFLKDSLQQGYYILLPLSVVGMGYVWKYRKREPFALSWMLALVFFVVVFHTMVNKSWDELHTFIVMTRFWQQANLIFWVFSGWGVFYLLKRWRTTENFKNKMIAVATTVAVVLVISVQYRSNDQSENNRYDQYGKWLLDNLPKNSILLLDGDTEINVTRYLQVCENYRPDITILEKNLLRSEWFTRYVQRKKPSAKIPGEFYHPTRKDAGAYQHRAFFESNREAPIFVSHLGDEGSKEAEDQSWRDHYYLKPYGLFSQVLPKSRNPNVGLEQYWQKNEEIFSSFSIDQQDRYFHQPRIRMMRDLIVTARYQIGLWAIGGFGAENRSEKDLLKGVRLVEEIVASEKEFPRKYYTVIAAGYQKLAQKDKRYHDKLIETLEEYLKTNPPEGAEKNRARAIIQMAQKEAS